MTQNTGSGPVRTPSDRHQNSAHGNQHGGGRRRRPDLRRQLTIAKGRTSRTASVGRHLRTFPRPLLGLDNHEIAVTLGISHPTVSLHARRARQRLRDSLGL
ncbi:sigma-70 family RNA polymerase sigma factor [Streptomyces sp. TM32]|nr:sigma-70 family RNA polymerase sigma factor [Streptomyces sp. TM32]